ncbi:hypothetical protein Scep_027038 [Stephania cephalantha]|uniref:Uncharacterized protein n=1 Tax=Stephania cephalantha TaxID=152367 RepID=A0AAP0ELQ4_9MAGN
MHDKTIGNDSSENVKTLPKDAASTSTVLRSTATLARRKDNAWQEHWKLYSSLSQVTTMEMNNQAKVSFAKRLG